MQVDNVHTRDIAAGAAEVAALIDGLGTDRDRLWPSARWPTLPFELYGPLAAGSPAGHGPIRYRVQAYEPGRRLTFRFAPGLWLAGTHGFEIEPLGDRRTRLTHVLRGRIDPKLLPLWPIVRRCHDALITDLLAQAERVASGREVPDARRPLWLRVAGDVDRRLAGPRSRAVAGVAVPAALAALAALHAAWALGWHWPGGSERELAERVLSGGSQMPPEWATWTVAAALAGAAVIVRAAAARRPPRLVRRLAWTVAGVFAIRGVVYLPVDLLRGLDGIYERLDLAIYSPLCLLLGAGTAAVARRPAP
jgi:hypothetical protein